MHSKINDWKLNNLAIMHDESNVPCSIINSFVNEKINLKKIVIHNIKIKLQLI